MFTRLLYLVIISSREKIESTTMTSEKNSILNQVLKLTSAERAVIAEQLLISLDSPDSRIDALWAKEAEARIDAHDRGEIEAVSVDQVFGKYDKP